MAKEKIGSAEKKAVVKKLLKRLKPYRVFVILSLVCAAVTVAGSLYIPIAAGRAIDCIVGKGKVDMGRISEYLGAIAAVTALAALSQWLMNICNNRITYNITRDIRNEAMEKIQRLPLSYIDNHSSGDIVSRIISDVDQFADGLLMGFTQFFTGVVTIFGTIGFMFSIHYAIALLVVILTPLSLLVAAFISKRTFSMFSLQSRTRGEQTSLIEEMIGAQRVVKAFGYEQRAAERFEEVNDRLKDCSLKATFFSSLTNPATRFVNSMIYAGVALSGAFLAVGGSLTVGYLTSLLSYANQYTKPFNEITGVITELQSALVCAGRIFRLTDASEQTPDGEDAISLENVKGDIEIDGVSFSYSPDKKLIENFDLSVKNGKQVAIVGPTGCGKTTIINLLMRFYDVDKGGISIDGTDLRDIKRKSVRRSFGMVLQETWFRSGTVRENITMGDDSYTDEQIIAAAKEAHSYEFIRRMPKGLDTYVTEDGAGMSQGQKQLLCITRVMLALPDMLILDEATSSIDTRTEMKIQNAFAKMTEGRTSFIVAHRLSTIRNADIIIVMKDGKIIEQGNHESLLAKKGFYAQLYESRLAK